ncbi:MAG: hypothetical protein WCK98_03130 [bacterium]
MSEIFRADIQKVRRDTLANIIEDESFCQSPQNELIWSSQIKNRLNVNGEIDPETRVRLEIQKIISYWIENNQTSNTPSAISIIELSLRSVVGVKKILSLMEKPLEITNGDDKYIAYFDKVISGSNRLRYERQASKILIVPSEQYVDDELGIDVMEELTPQLFTNTLQTPEDIIDQSPKSQEINEVFQWFKRTNGTKNWILYSKNITEQIKFAKLLVDFSEGKPVEFVIWNCIGFDWFQDIENKFPTCKINSNRDASITLYFKERINEVAKQLSKLGSPRITVLLPTNEAFDDRVWNYNQERQDREQIMDDAVLAVQKGFEDVDFPQNCFFKVMRWDEYVSLKTPETAAEEYSELGEQKLRKSPIFTKILKEAVRSGNSYFTDRFGIKISNEILSERQIRYYGVYAGEGVFFNRLQNELNITTCLINLEEARVPQNEYLGSDGSLCVVTPAQTSEINQFYAWEKKQLNKR